MTVSNTICGVVKQGWRPRCQFSWWCDGRPDQVEEQRYDVAKEIAARP
jgi:spore germination cell wall hydrolase CwlJ-like protein